jgi:hypothetical protein
MKHIKLFFISIIIAVSCSKDQRVVNQLEGDWKVVSQIEDGVAQPDSTYKNTTYTFQKCKVKKGDCGGSVSEDGKAIPFTYRISEKGEKITFTLFGISETGTIREHSKTRFVWVTDDGKHVDETTIEKK